MASQFDDLLGHKKLADLPTSPKFTICATSLSHGALWRFQRDRIGDDVFGFEHPPQSECSLAMAVAASATFAPFFVPFRLQIDDPSRFVGGRRRRFNVGAFEGSTSVLLSDGGVYDNLGLEAVWRTNDALFVSDAGAPLAHEWNPRWLSRLGSIWRVADLNDQFGRLARRRWFISLVEEKVVRGAYWGISSTSDEITREPGAFPGYSAGLVRDVIAKTRTDLNAFTDTEMRVLENHGYMLASAAVQTYGAPAFGLTLAPRVLQPPHAGNYLDEAWVRQEILADRGALRRAKRIVASWFSRAAELPHLTREA